MTNSTSHFFSDINDKPEIVNLPLSHPLGVFENTPLGTTVFTVAFVDLDPDDTHSIQATFDPTWAVNYFHLNESSKTTRDVLFWVVCNPVHKSQMHVMIFITRFKYFRF